MFCISNLPDFIDWLIIYPSGNFIAQNKGENIDLLFIGNFVSVVLVQPTWHLIRLYVAPEPEWVCCKHIIEEGNITYVKPEEMLKI